MSSTAIAADNSLIDAECVAPAAWQVMQATWQHGLYRMTCCLSTAVLKTSINGVQFFAHASGECATAPETRWHRAGKAAVLAGLSRLGIKAEEEVSGASPHGRWKADVLFEHAGRTVAIEMQRSYQTLTEYQRRQARYASAGVESHWLTTQENFLTFTRASGRLRLKRDLGGVMPASGYIGPMLPELPVAFLNLADDSEIVKFGGLRQASLSDWLRGVLEQRYVYDETGFWLLRD